MPQGNLIEVGEVGTGGFRHPLRLLPTKLFEESMCVHAADISFLLNTGQ